jgi:ATP-binding cassette, subfamily B, bacterial PglK
MSVVNLNFSILKSIRHLYGHISSKRKIQFLFLLILTIIVAFAEVVSIGSIIPFIGALTNPDYIYNHEMAQPFFLGLGLNDSSQILLPLTVIFVFLVVAATLLRVLLTLLSVKISFGTGIDLSIDIYYKTLYQPYLTHVGRNSSDVINTITVKVSEVIFYIIMPLVNFISSAIVAIFILTIIIYFTPNSALLVLFLLAFSYILIVTATRKKLLKNSQAIAEESTQVIKTLQEGLGGIRDILIDGTQEKFCNTYADAVRILRRAQGDNQIFNIAPRFIVEGIGILFISSLGYILSQQEGDIMLVMPLLASIAFAMQRLLPTMQLLYSSWSQINGSQASLRDTLVFLDQELPKYSAKDKLIEIDFRKNICLKNVSFFYENKAQQVLKDAHLIIKKGDRVGFIGSTGSGKSTLVDIIMGLIQPSAGELTIDGKIIDTYSCRSWQSMIAHVPQTIFLLDGTIEENIAFGVDNDEIDHERIKDSARMAKISAVIEKLPSQYQTTVGERGVQLSGGQRQRIGIARAFYKKAKVIILDEATSSLDVETERGVMESFEELSDEITVLMIAHRISTLKDCNLIIKVENGKLLPQ